MSPPYVRVFLFRLPAVVASLALCLLGCGASLPDEARIHRVVDGDTVRLLDGRSIRYLGIDTPEVRRRVGDRWVMDPEPMAHEATALNRRLVEGKVVRLEYDVQTHDKYGRLLAYVYAGEVMVNAELLRAGLAQPLTIPPNGKYTDAFRALADEARRERRGMWRRTLR